jgi:hypothetical protein
MRLFKSAAEVNKHERISKLHQQNILDDVVREKAINRLAKVTQPAYRDRARERRVAFARAKRATEDQNQDKEADVEPVAISKGASLLGKMGYVQGHGLGATGQGVTEAISQNAYVRGVGLGADGGRLGDAGEVADRQTTGDYADFVKNAREKARERFHRIE